ncbi:MAG: ABC transporter substrate-binding protein, partial [Methyloceanibacter sp.]|nr:ABC transporter substrate-binding protein [Methyloceanibacter sp.]
LHTKYLSPKGFNAGYYSRAEVDLLLDRARTEQGESWRTALYREAHRLIMEDAAVLPVVTHRRGLVVHAPQVRNFKFPRQNWHDFRRVWLDL